MHCCADDSSLSDELCRLGLIGTSEAFRAALSKAVRLADCKLPVLLCGETGTGKELFARAIHYGGCWSNGPLIPVNCGAIPDQLFENELFGHERGAFTDAREPFRGLLLQAHGGTLFLDEVGSLSLGAQVKLLRFLEDSQIKPLGAAASRSVHVRVVAASNEDLEDRVRARTFREDLFYRLRAVSVCLPPLRERLDDVEALALAFVKRTAEDAGITAPAISPAALNKLKSHRWPGNVRELKNAVQAASILCRNGVIEAADLELGGTQKSADHYGTEPMGVAKAKLVRAFEIDYLQKAIQAAHGNISEAARTARKNRRAFFALLKKHGLLSAHPQ